MDISATFQSATEFIKNSKNIEEQIDDDDQLELYALYKQATIGDCNTECPNIINYINYCKWNAWNKLYGQKKKDAKQKYILKLKDLNIGYS